MRSMRSMSKKRKIILLSGIIIILILSAATGIFAEGDEEAPASMFYATGWSLLPPLVTIVLALVTREVYSALFIGVAVGAFLYSDFHILKTIDHIIYVLQSCQGEYGGITVFVITLGILIAMFQATGCAQAIGDWALENLKTKRQALIGTTLLGLLFVIDDYFNALTTGNVMRPVTDAQKVSRARLAYNVDCTAAPICIIMPISTWGAAVASYIPPEVEEDGFMLFIQSIPMNFYAINTLFMLFTLAILKFDFGPMRRYEYLAEQKGDLYGGTGDLYAASKSVDRNANGKVIDMILPVVVLIGSCIFGLMYSGGILDGAGFIESFNNADAFLGLPVGGIIALVFAIVYFFARRVLTLPQFTDALPAGAVAMMPALLLIMFAWGLEMITRGSLGAGEFIANTFADSNFPMWLLPAMMYIIGSFVSFATGTSWGTFGILIPISTAMFGFSFDDPLAMVTLSATLAGGVTGDHCSPVSETAIMSSTAAQVDLMTHVLTQLPYALFSAGFSLVGFIIAGLFPNPIITPILVIGMIVTIILIKKAMANKPVTEPIKYVSKKARDVQAKLAREGQEEVSE